MKIIRIGLDTAKHVFQVHGVDENEQAVVRRQLGRSEVAKFFAKLPMTRIGLEACGASHHWARILRGLGHEVVLIPPQYIKPGACPGEGRGQARQERRDRRGSDLRR
jgi:transposase